MIHPNTSQQGEAEAVRIVESTKALDSSRSEFQPQLCPSPARRYQDAIFTFSKPSLQTSHGVCEDVSKHLCDVRRRYAQEAHSTLWVPFLSQRLSKCCLKYQTNNTSSLMCPKRDASQVLTLRSQPLFESGTMINSIPTDEKIDWFHC